MQKNTPYSSQWSGSAPVQAPQTIMPAKPPRRGWKTVLEVVFVVVFISFLGLAAIPLITS
jgi:hypothetical protein